jgi:hypothetical protein
MDVYYFDTELPVFRERILLQQKAYLFDFDWNTRLSDWRVTVTPEGETEPIAVNMRVGEGCTVFLTDGAAMFFGKEPYQQSALRDYTVFMITATLDEINSGVSGFQKDPLPELV